jgi:hypothetical protein
MFRVPAHEKLFTDFSRCQRGKIRLFWVRRETATLRRDTNDDAHWSQMTNTQSTVRFVNR